MSCSHEHSGSSCDHSDQNDVEFSLFSQINTLGVKCLNCVEAENGSKIFKPWDRRLDTDFVLRSDDDEEMIIFVPFVSSVKLKSIGLLGLGGGSDPAAMKVFINREDVDFDTVNDITPTQQFDCIRDGGGMIPDYKTQASKFSNIRNLTLFIPSNFGAEQTVVSYIGFNGDFTVLKQDPIITNYEVGYFLTIDCSKPCRPQNSWIEPLVILSNSIIDIFGYTRFIRISSAPSPYSTGKDYLLITKK